jgi:hypothetical protein
LLAAGIADGTAFPRLLLNVTATTFSAPVFTVTNHDRPMQPKGVEPDEGQRVYAVDDGHVPSAFFHIRLETLIPGEYSVEACAMVRPLACTTFRFLVGHAALHPLDAYTHTPRLRLISAYAFEPTHERAGGLRLQMAPVRSEPLETKWAPPLAAVLFGAFMPPDKPAVLTMYDNHDAGVCVAVGGEILLLLELESARGEILLLLELESARDQPRSSAEAVYDRGHRDGVRGARPRARRVEEVDARRV